MSASERAECQKISDADKERYYEEMRNYVPLPDEKEEEPAPRYDKDGNRKRRKRIKRAAQKPKRTSSGRKSTAKSTFDRRLRRRKLFLSATKRRNSATRGRR